jgi:LPXTG-motif cell wall-anchored protein
VTARAAALLLSCLAAAAGGSVAPALADGDPASDYLVGQQVFLPFDAKFPARSQAELASAVAAANRAGFRIRVALISNSYDMGSVTSLYAKPRAYAKFLGEELAFVYRGRLLVVMPNGFGFNRPGHPAAPGYALLQPIGITRGDRGLIGAAQTALRRLTSASGVRVAGPADAGARPRTGGHGATTIVAAAVAALLLGAAALVALRRRRA